MAGDIIFPEWLNANSVRAYPFSESGSRLDMTGNYKLTDSFIVDAVIHAPPTYAEGDFFISQVGVFEKSILVDVSYALPDSEAQLIAQLAIPTDTHVDGANYAFVGQGQNSYVLGSLTIGNLRQLQSEFAGFAQFLAASTPFEIHAVSYSSPAMRSIDLYDGGTYLQTFNDIMRLRAGQNIRLSYEGDTDTVRVDAVMDQDPQDEVQAKCASAEGVRLLSAPIRTINGYPPDENGNFNIEGSDCILVNPGTEASLTLEDQCSVSCCGCNELKALSDAQATVDTEINSLRATLAIVNANQQSLLAQIVSMTSTR